MRKSAYSRSNRSILFWRRQNDHANERRLEEGAFHTNIRCNGCDDLRSEYYRASFVHPSYWDNNIVSPSDELRTCQSPGRKVWIIHTLGALYALSATAEIQECLGDQNPAVRAAAVSSIAKMRELPALEALAMAARHPDPTVRDLAKWARFKKTAELSSEEIVESLEDLWQQHPESK